MFSFLKLLFYLFIYFRKRESISGGRSKERRIRRGKESQVDSTLSAEPDAGLDAGLDPTTLRLVSFLITAFLHLALLPTLRAH